MHINPFASSGTRYADLQDRPSILDEYSITMLANMRIISCELRKTLSSRITTWASLQYRLGLEHLCIQRYRALCISRRRVDGLA